MPDLPSRTLLSLFIASPGDLVEERKRTRTIVDELNRSIGRTFNVYLELLGWEDTLPGVGRPQEIINQDVDACDLFIGILWRRWGQATGIFSSGFEEEFERARERRKNTGSPEIWLAFKRVDADQLRDPGEHLKRVLIFREAQETARELLYKEFSDPDDWTRQLREWLTTYVAERAKQLLLSQSIPPAQEAESSPSERGELAPTTLESAEDPLPEQAVSIVDKLYGALHKRDQDSYIDAIVEFDKWDAIRLQLMSKAIVSQLYTTDPLAVHDVNLLYLYRERLERIPPEGPLLLRTLILDGSETSPGWYWFRDWSEDDVRNALFNIVAHFSGYFMRVRALELLGIGHIKPTTKESRDALSTTLIDDDSRVTEAGFNYLRSVADPELVGFVDAAEAHASSGPSVESSRTRLALLLVKSPSEPLTSMLLGDLDPTSNLTAALEEHISGLSSESLARGLDHSNREVRRLAAVELAKRGELDVQRAESLNTDPSRKIREVAYRTLIGQGRRFTPAEISEALKSPNQSPTPWLSLDDNAGDADSVILALYQTYSAEELEAEVDWFSGNGRLAYEALALRGDRDLSAVRSDLAENFEGIYEKSRNRLESRYGSVAAKSLADSYKDVDDYIGSQFKGVVMRLLASNGDSSDLPRALSFLSDRDHQYSKKGATAALQIIGRFGTAAEVPSLLAYAKSTYGELRDLALATSVAISPGASGIATGLLDSDNPDDVRHGFKALESASFADVDRLAFRLLRSDRDDIRLWAAAVFVLVSTDEELLGVMNRYLSQETYFYNVACWLDRCLYAPAPLRQAFREQLLGKLGLEQPPAASGLSGTRQ